jgi:hypothetical protein
MPYVTKAAKKIKEKQERDRTERQHWMTLVEAIGDIKAKEHCGDQQALEDLFCAIVDENVRALSGGIRYKENSLGGYVRLSPNDLQREIKVCLDAPGFIDVEHYYDLDPKDRKYDYPEDFDCGGPDWRSQFR